MMTGQKSGTWDEGTEDLSSWVVLWPLKDPFLCLLAIPEIFLEGDLALSLSMTGYLPQLNPGSSVTILFCSLNPSPSPPQAEKNQIGNRIPSPSYAYQQVGPFSSWRHVHKVCSCLLEQFTWRKRSHWLTKI